MFASNRAAALLQLDKLNKALDDAEMTIKLKPQWEKVNKCSSNFLHINSVGTLALQFCLMLIEYIYVQGYFRKGSILEAMKRYDDVCIIYITAT